MGDVLRLKVGGTEAVVDYDDWFVLYPVGGKNLSACRRCGSLSVAPGSHLEYHISTGSLQVRQAQEESDVRSEAGGAEAGLDPEVGPGLTTVQDRAAGAGGPVLGGEAEEPPVDEEGMARPGA